MKVVETLGRAWELLVRNKARLGVLVLFCAGGLQAVGLTDVSGPLFVLAGWLHGAGTAPSDREAKARQ